MTKEEWIEKYYPTPAEACPDGDAAVEHSIRKWEGIAWARENHFNIPITVSASSCALCRHYYAGESPNNRCAKCPLALSLGYSCDATKDAEGGALPWGSPWFDWMDHKDPYPMLNALKDIPPCQE